MPFKELSVRHYKKGGTYVKGSLKKQVLTTFAVDESTLKGEWIKSEFEVTLTHQRDLRDDN